MEVHCETGAFSQLLFKACLHSLVTMDFALAGLVQIIFSKTYRRNSPCYDAQMYLNFCKPIVRKLKDAVKITLLDIFHGGIRVDGLFRDVEI